MMNFVAAAAFGLLSVALSGCADKPPAEILLPAHSISGGEKTVTVMAATTRRRSNGDPDLFTSDRTEALNYQEYTVSIPPNHVVGQIEWPSGSAGNAGTQYLVASNRPLTESGFATALRVQLASRKDYQGSVLVYVHGYYSSHQEAVFRGAELAADLQSAAGAVVVFSWPSRNDLTEYVTDRESATYSRDYLERLLNEIAEIPSVRSINLVAHSMGNWLAMETLRQAKLRERSPFVAKLNQVVLLAPDIDVDVFRTQLDAIGKLKHPIIVAISRDDLALAASQRIAGDVPRVGNVLIDNPRAQAAIERYGLEVVDLSQVNSSDYLGHSKFAEAVPELQNIAASGANRRGGPLQRAGIFVLDSTGRMLSAPAVIGDALQR
jgi:esterase/lipase superfamily enzyme